MIRAFYLSLVAVLVLVAARDSQAVLVQTQIFSETFDTNTSDLATTITTYPDWTGIAGGGTINVNSNRLEINKSGANQFLTTQSFNEEIWVSLDMGGTPNSGVSNGQYATALVIGNRAFQFFPGCCGGALRIYNFDPNTGNFGAQLSSPGDIVMPGFTPASNVMHHIQMHSTTSGQWDLTFTDGSNPLNVYTQTFNFGGFVPGQVGFSAFHGSNISFFDNITISALREEVLPAPEPTSAALLGMGGLMLMVASRKRRRGNVQKNTPPQD